MKLWQLPAIISELNLKEWDVFADVGGYHGDATSLARKLFNCTCYVYEPYLEFYEICRKRFEGDEKVIVKNYGLGLGTERRRIYFKDDGTSLFGTSDISAEVDIRDAKEEFLKINPRAVKLNCEGAEFEILESMKGNLAFDMLIQFHDVHKRKEAIMELRKTHTQVWPKPRRSWDLWRSDELYDRKYFKDSRVFQENKERIGELVSIIESYQPKTVLDVGCGPANIIRRLRTDGIEAYGIDFAPTLITDYRLSEFVAIADARNLPYPSKSFDLVFSSDFFEHIEEQNIDRVYREMKRVGRLVLARIACEDHLNERQQRYHLTNKPIEWWKEKLPDAVLV